jgi:regulator of sigma E protease
MAILLFFIVLFILILVHEWGHFIVAKKTGMRVDEFGIGFPPKLFSIKKGETEYSFNSLPIGGFVRIWGENYEQEFSPVAGETSDRRSEAIAEAGEGGTRVVDTSRAFGNRPKWAQILVLIAGVSMNILFAWFLFTVTALIGTPTPVDEAVATESAELYVVGVLPDSPAAVVPAGAKVTSITAGEIFVAGPTATEFSDVVQQANGTPVTITYDINGDTELVTITPVRGLIAEQPDRYVVGASLALFEIQQMDIITAISDGFASTWHGLVAISAGLWNLISQTFSGNADLSQVAGPIGIVGLVGDAASYGITALLTFTAIISLNLAVINLLPFPALDGGRVVFVLIEAVTRRRIPPEWAGRVNLAGFAILMFLMIAVTYNDIARLL